MEPYVALKKLEKDFIWHKKNTMMIEPKHLINIWEAPQTNIVTKNWIVLLNSFI